MLDSWKTNMAYKLLVIRFLLYSLVSLGLTWTTATNGVSWDSMTRFETINLFIGVFCVWGTTMMAFFDKTIAKLDPSFIPLTDEEKRQIAKETTT